jgi:tetratricopeptide (TPR) repeat protein
MLFVLNYFDCRSKMKNTIFVVATLFVFVLGCQTAHRPQWLTPQREGGSPFLGQAPINDPFAVAMNPAPVTPVPVFDPFAPVQQNTLVADTTAKDTDRERIRTLATTARDGSPDYLQPLNPWSGPFANRNRTKVLEQDIIRQVGYEQVNVKFYSTEPEYDWEKEEPKKGFDWSMLDPANTFSRMRDWMGLGPDESKANESMQKGREILLANPDLKDQKKNLEAAKHFTEAGKKFPDSVLEEDALHLAAECYFFADDYYNAFLAYQKLVVKYHHSKYVDNAVRRLFKIGRYWEHESERGRSNFNFSNKSLPNTDTFGFAKKSYETIFTFDPLGPVADDALMALATAYLKRGRYQGDENFNQAAFYYQRLREEHPSSKHIAKAYENELYVRTRAYLGAEHPSKTLEEARKLTEITLWQFDHELDSESKANILETKERILTKEAEREWSMGQFYDLKKRHYGSARLHYHKLIADYPQTEFAERARKRLVQIEGQPDTPGIFGWPINPFKVEE